MGEICDKKSSNISANSLENNEGKYKIYGATGFLKNIDFYIEENGYIAIVKDGAGVGRLFLCEPKTSVLGTLDIIQSKNIDLKFLYYFLNTLDFSKYTIGSTIPHIYFKDYKNEKIYLPSLEEQTKIASFLSKIDERISTQRVLIEDLEKQRKFIRKILFLDVVKNNDFVEIKELLNYEQPTKYIVSDTNYNNDNSLVPVLTANKAFILGYTEENFGIYNRGNCIIFDDFTMDLKFVDFAFKVKSSAIKILTAKEYVNLKFIYEYLQFLNLSSSEHKRHYISFIEPMEIAVPTLEKQNRIAKILFALDQKIHLENQLFEQYQQQKKYLLQKMFV